MAILGIDFGLRRIGIAFSNPDGTIAFAGPVIRGDKEKDCIRRIADEAELRGATTIVVGLPKNMNGSEGPMSAQAKVFAENLREATSAEIVMWDERLTTVQAGRSMLSGDLSRKKRQKRIDSLAAQLMLQSYLDAKSKVRKGRHADDDRA